ncbi:TPA: Fe-S cluster assembly ATPase SufC [archaeon]|nr:Fe-S cluster assembly ATPase SufC [Candidatus Naiadarchaeales archaeon SRR2090159.bin1288]
MAQLEIRDLHVSVEGKPILKGLNLSIREGEVHAIMGPNGSGKSTLAFTVMGHPKYKVEKGEILFDRQNISALSVEKRAKLGLFLGFQYPSEVSGVSVFNFLKTAYNSLKVNGHKDKIGSANITIGSKDTRNEEMVSALAFQNLLKEKMKLLKMDESFMRRSVNEGFSGGEKKRCEILQLATLEPKIAVLDESDSGTDVDALKVIADGIRTVSEKQNTGVLLITHYNRILQYVKPQFVHILKGGKIVQSGGPELANEVERDGYDKFLVN